MRRLISILTVCLGLTLAFHLAYPGTARLPLDGMANKASLTLSYTYQIIESLLLPGTIKTAAVESTEEEKSEGEQEVTSSTDKDEQEDEKKEEGSIWEAHFWKPMI
jgi:hypothetical protein